MTYLDKNQEENILNEVVVSKFELLSFLLDIITKNPQITQSELKRKSKYSGGKIYSCVKAMRTMKLIENGNGLRITDLGSGFLASHNSNNKEDFKTILKISCLNVPLFSKIYENNKEITEAKKLFELFEEEIKDRYENIDPKLLGAIVRRYLHGIHGIKLRIGFKFRPIKKENLMGRGVDKKRNDKEVIEALRNLKKNLNLSEKEFNIIINSLPEKKKEEVLSQIFSKVFK